MSRQTKTDSVIEFLGEVWSCRETDSPSRKYRRFVSPRGTVIWVGRAGGVRCGPTVTQSVSLTQRMDFIMAAARSTVSATGD